MTISPLSSPLSPDLKTADPISLDTQATLDRLARSVKLNKTAGLAAAPEVEGPIARDADSVSFSEVDEALEKLGPLVKRLRATAERFANVDASVLEYEIDRALRPFRESNGGKFPGGIEAGLDSSYVSDIALKGRGFAAGDSVDLSVEIAEVAEFAQLFLELGASASGANGTISLGGTNSTFDFAIAGQLGTQELSFSSGQTLGQIAAAISSFASETGVEAVVSGTGIRLTSTGAGSDAFTSLTFTTDNSIEDNGSGNTLGVYQLDGEQDAADVPDGGLDPESGAVVDEGSDAVVLINGESAEQVGDYWVANVDGRLDVAVDLDEEAILAAGGSVSLGTVGKPHPGRGPDGLGAPGQLKKAERERALEERETSGTETSRDTDSEPPVDEATPLSKDATDRLSAIDVNA